MSRLARLCLVLALGVSACHAVKKPQPPAPRLRIETEVTWVASFVHFVDSLAGTSEGKTVPTYRRLWVARFGQPEDEAGRALTRFFAARDSRRAQQACGSAAESWRARFIALSLEARDLAGFLASIRGCVTEAEADGLASALETFRPGFDRFWEGSGYLRRFDERFRSYLDEGALTDYLGDVAAFFDVDLSAAPRPVLSFVLLPSDGDGTHATAIGRRLLIEVRPSDEPADQVQVVSHEMSHFFFGLLPPARLAAIEERARAAGPDGERVWTLLREALPTALGQGLAVERLTPDEFDRSGSSWYHIRAIDRFAKRIFPIVKREIEAGRTIDGPFLDEAIRAYARGGPVTP